MFAFLTLLFTVAGQLLLKWQTAQTGAFAIESAPRHFFNLFTKPWFLVGYGCAFVASLFWVLALSRLELSRAYPIMALSFVAITVFGNLFFGEPLTLGKIVGVIVVSIGVAVIALT